MERYNLREDISRDLNQLLNHENYIILKVICADKSTKVILHTIAHELYHEGFKLILRVKLIFINILQLII